MDLRKPSPRRFFHTFLFFSLFFGVCLKSNAENGDLLWKSAVYSPSESEDLKAIGESSTNSLYFFYENGVYSKSMDSTDNWKKLFYIPSIDESTAAVDDSGNIYVLTSSRKKINSLGSSGNSLWSYDPFYFIGGDAEDTFLSFLLIENVVYLVTRTQKLISINTDGTLNWVVALEQLNENDVSIKASDNGTIYVTSKTKSFAVGNDGIMKWEFDYPDNKEYREHQILSDNSVFALTTQNELHKISSEGELEWSLPNVGWRTRLAVNKQAKIAYVKTESPYPERYGDVIVKAYDIKGDLLWTLDSDSVSNLPKFNQSLVSQDGTLHLLTRTQKDYQSGYNYGLIAVSMEGKITWQVDISKQFESSIVYGKGYHDTPLYHTRNGTILINTFRNHIIEVSNDGSSVSLTTNLAPVSNSVSFSHHGLLYTLSDEGGGSYFYPDSGRRTHDSGKPTLKINSTPVFYREKPYLLTRKGDIYMGNNRIETDSDFTSSVAMSANDSMYVSSLDNSLYAIKSVVDDRTFDWVFSTDGKLSSSPSVGLDGNIYVGSHDFNVYSISPTGNEMWRFATNGVIHSSPSIAQDGTIYVGSRDRSVYALNVDGTLKWKYETKGEVNSSPSIGTDGSIYIGSDDGALYALSVNGELIWKYQTQGKVTSSPAIGKDGTIFFGSHDNYFYAINTDGTLKWSYETFAEILSSPSINIDGTVYITGMDGYLYAFSDDNGGLARSDWPKYRYNIVNTANPFDLDVDDDGLTDEEEYAAGSNPYNKDSDGDGLSDGDEVHIYGSNPLSSDSDNDGLSDYSEIHSLGTSPIRSDSDGDGFSDLEEITLRSDPNDPNSTPVDPGRIKWKGPTSWKGTIQLTIRNAILSNSGMLAVDVYRYGEYGGLSPGTILYTLNNKGERLWERNFDQNIKAKAYGSNDRLYLVASSIPDEFNSPSYGKIISINRDGSYLWGYRTEQPLFSMALSKNDTVYAMSSDTLYAISSDGALLWQQPYSSAPHSSGAMVIDAVGNIILYNNIRVMAFNKEGQLQWQYEVNTNDSNFLNVNLAIDAQNNIYVVAEESLTALTSDGTFKWIHEGGISGKPLIGKNGSVYVFKDKTISTFNSEGSLTWSSESNDDFTGEFILTEAGGSVHFNQDGKVFGVNSEGLIDWYASSPGKNDDQKRQGITIDTEGTVYVATGYQVSAVRSDKGRVLNSPWPMPGHDNKNTANVNTHIKGFTAYDYNNKGLAQLIFRRKSTSQFIRLSIDEKEITRTTFGVYESDIPIHGDYDGDGIADIAIRRPALSQFVVLGSQNGEVTRATLGQFPDNIPVPGDFDGDGKDDLAVFSPSEGVWTVRHSIDNNETQFTFGEEGDIPVPADYDGDGVTDYAYRRPSTGRWYIKMSSSSQIIEFYLGSQETDIPVPADYDGDGKVDVAVRRPATGMWYYLSSSTKELKNYYFGASENDIPVPADYDGDGKADIAIRRPSGGWWFYHSSIDDKTYRIYFGSLLDDIPVAAPISEKMKMLPKSTVNSSMAENDFRISVTKEPIEDLSIKSVHSID